MTGKTIFISPLDWGMGHATRCVPVIRRLEKENKIIIGVTPLTRRIFDEEFPNLEKTDVPAYAINYSRLLPLWMKLVLAWPGIEKVIKTENKLIGQLIRSHNIDVVISDNRFGLFSKEAHSIFITHQVFLKAPFAAGIAQSQNKKYIQNFHEVWIPDYENDSESLSGALSHGAHFHPQIKYIGPQTRLQKKSQVEKYDYLILLSGPEPQQSILKDLLVKKAAQHPDLKFALAAHSGAETDLSGLRHLETFFAPDKNKLSELISASRKIICRSGYSTLMDLHLLGKKEMILIPTPGQSEQEYLARYWQKKFNATCVRQDAIKEFKLL